MGQPVALVRRELHGRADEQQPAYPLLPQALGHFLTEPVFQQLSLKLPLQLLGFLMPGEQGDGFHVNQPGGHGEELAGDLQIRRLHLVDIVQILGQQTGDFNVVDVQLVLGDQMEKQLQRALKYIELELKLFHGYSSLSSRSIKPVRISSRRYISPVSRARGRSSTGVNIIRAKSAYMMMCS